MTYWGRGGYTEFDPKKINNTKQCVCNGVILNVMSLYTGVPQGSTLGLLLFLICIIDLPCIFENTKCMMFADNTVLFQSLNNSVGLNNEAKESLDKMYTW